MNGTTMVHDLDESLDRIAVRDDAGAWTRRELADAVRNVHGALLDAGVRPGDRVAVCAKPCAKAIALLLGARSAGAIVAPVDFKAPHAALARFRPEIVLGDVPVDAAFRVVSTSTALNGPAARRAAPAEGVGWALPTSGTTSGIPRITLITAASVRSIVDDLSPIQDYRASDTVLCALPFHHVYGLSQIWFALRVKATLLVPPLPILDGELAHWVRRASIFPAIPRWLRVLERSPDRPRPRLITISGQAALPEERVRFSHAFPGSRLLQFYGLTEAFRVLWIGDDEFSARPEATGRPTPYTRASLDEAGELWIEGPHVAAGYLDDPAATTHRFPAPGRVRTGDVFTFDGEMYSFVGRRDGVFKSFGEKVVPEVVERALCAHGAVEQCLVAPASTDGELRPVALVVSRRQVSAAELMTFVRRRIPAAMTPADIRFVDALPTTATGKVMRTSG